ncbi:MAG: hypothetical protein Q7P63_04045 [Verrucomicrobiota bacterium JB022]|nr:hypothetical protein [Verrucomicrobiota bacterium JB022]
MIDRPHRLTWLLAGALCAGLPLAAHAQDADRDGYTDAQEIWLGTNPQDGTSYLKSNLVIDNGFFLTFTPKATSANYRYFWTHEPSGAWTELSGLASTEVDGLVRVTLPDLAQSPYNLNGNQALYLRVVATAKSGLPDFTPPPPPTELPPPPPDYTPTPLP